ncbi:MAG: HAD-IA family hydrolase [Clostridia bacterium]|nr:HAD-IA family hydrolase [Clostridia bacterium]
MPPRAVLFDCDGVLVDSEAPLARIAALALHDFGIPAEPENFAPFIGMGEDAYIGGVSQRYGFAYSLDMKKHVYDKYIELCGEMVRPMPGAVELLRTLRAAGVRIAMATSADRVKAGANLRVLGMDETGFDAVVTGDDVERKKPFPDIYLIAAARCGAEPADAWVVEDAESGVQAGKAAGMRVAGLTSALPAGRLLAAGADAVIAGLDELSGLLGL